jgi:hypothetical protein
MFAQSGLIAMTYVTRVNWDSSSSQGGSDLQNDVGALSKVIAQSPAQRECREKFETDDDSFDTADHWWKFALKTQGIINCGFGIPIA